MGPGRAWGRRRRRLFWTALSLAGGAAFAAAAGYALRRTAATAEYRPGEQIAEITSQLEQGIPEEAPRARFADVTTSAGLGGFRSFRGGRTSQLPEDMGAGAAWGDYDGDGDDDLFVVSNGGPLTAVESARARSRLYRNDGRGRFVEEPAFPETRIVGMAAAWGDHDADGDLDLALTGYHALRLYRNDGGRFARDPAVEDRAGFWAGASWADFDLDGDLDLYVCGYVKYVKDARGRERTTQQYGRSVPYTLNPASFEPEPNLLFRNDGPAGFHEVAGSLGADNPAGRSLGALWHDFDDDGRPDLYIANDISDNALLLNRAEGFVDSSHASWVADYRGAMGLAVGDWNRDGDDDLFVTHWVAQENALYDSLRVDMAARGQHGGLRFVDVADQLGLGQIALQRVGWGAEFFDLDSDGWLDLAVANGSTFETAERPPELRVEPPFLFWNRRGQSFHDLAPTIAALARPRVGRGLAISDYDDDGDQDLLQVDRDGGVRLLRNDTEQSHRIGFRLLDPTGAPLEMTRVELHLAQRVVQRTLGGVSYLSQSSRVLHFGLGRDEAIERIVVVWPDRERTVYHGAGVDARFELVRGESRPRRVAEWSRPAGEAPPSRERLAEFWRTQRAAMDAMKVDGEPRRSIELFRRALELNPDHADSLYYLANCLAETGDVDGALEQLDRLIRADPQSHRAHKRWGTLRASTAADDTQLEHAESALLRAARINPEETGVSLVLGELHLLRGDRRAAQQRLEWVVRTNPQSGEAFFVLGYLAWAAGDDALARRQLMRARATRGNDTKPRGFAAEGDTRRKMHDETSLFEPLYRAWDGETDPAASFAALTDRLARRL
ncbi:MAG TPA: FG-GAP-like repeat-containing protein [Candidatus Polarisedimenticolaceae bacterium]|nr:FG-GAP-like repeat-containing protein [Candidatus Polarisedimenticolaceae bacterium]